MNDDDQWVKAQLNTANRLVNQLNQPKKEPKGLLKAIKPKKAKNK